MSPIAKDEAALSDSEAARTYHHGGLRQGLVAAALRILEDQGVDAVTLRAVAAASGVSRQAPYHHFADKSALMAAVGADGFRALSLAMETRMAKADTALGRLTACGVAYVAFAVESPALFRLMFGGAGDNFVSDADLARARARSYVVLNAALQAIGMVAPEELELKGLAAWSLVHGLAELINKGAVAAPPFGAGEGEAFVQDVLVSGLRL
jgi:AcrR family transcriptional regulator